MLKIVVIFVILEFELCQQCDAGLFYDETKQSGSDIESFGFNDYVNIKAMCETRDKNGLIFLEQGTLSTKITKVWLENRTTTILFNGNLIVAGELHIAISVSGNFIFVCNTIKNVILRIQISTGTVINFAGSSSGYRDGHRSTALFSNPRGIVLSNSGTYMLVADGYNGLIRKISNGQVTTLIGNGFPDNVNEGIGIEAGVWNVYNMVITSDDKNLYVVGLTSFVLQHVDLTTNKVTKIAGSGICQTKNGYGFAAGFSRSRFLAMSPNEKYLITSDSGRLVEAFGTVNLDTMYVGQIITKTNQLISTRTYDDSTGMMIMPDNKSILITVNRYRKGLGFQKVWFVNCIQCPAGKYKLSNSTALCTNCVPGEYSTDIRAMSGTCINCAAGKSTPLQKSPITSIPLPTRDIISTPLSTNYIMSTPLPASEITLTSLFKINITSMPVPIVNITTPLNYNNTNISFPLYETIIIFTLNVDMPYITVHVKMRIQSEKGK